MKRPSFLASALTALFFCLVAGSLLLTVATPASALDAEEILDDPELESRARGLSLQLRCLVCQNQSIDDSDADLARDLRREVRTQLLNGKSDDDILTDLRNRYGDYILLEPPITRSTYLLWLAPWLIIVMALGLFWMYRRTPASPSPPLRDDEDRLAAMSEENTPLSNSPHLLMGSVALGSLILIVSIGIYSLTGRPDLASQPLADRGDELAAAQAQSEERTQAVDDELEAARQEVAKTPGSVEAYLRLGMAAAQAGAFDEEIEALETALSLTDGNLVITSMLAEALSRQANGLVTLPARELVARVLKEDPEEPRALFISGLAAFQDEAYGTALAFWVKLEGLSTPDAPWSGMLRRNIEQAAEAGGLPLPPPPAQTAQSLSPDIAEQIMELSEEEQTEMILSMVASLEDRLAENTDDAEGWERLILSRRSLDDEEGLMRALFGAADIFQDDANIQRAAIEEMLKRDLGSEYLQQGKQALTRLRQLRPEGLEVLFFSGHFARIEGQPEEAASYWRALIDQLPPGSEFADQLSRQIDELRP